MAATTGLVTVMLQYVFALLYDPHPPVPYGFLPGSAFCGGKYHHLLPNLETALVYHYWVLVVAHELYLGNRVTPWHRLRHVATLLFVPITLVLSNDSTTSNAFYGVALGLATGVVTSIVFLLVLVPRLPLVAPWLQLLSVNHLPAELDKYAAEHASRGFM
jgi:hypothetical protein